MAHMQTSQIDSPPPRPPVEVCSEPIAEISATLLRAQAFLSGCGIALMVREGRWLVCRASNGAAAPEIGTRIAVENTFLGLCITLKKPQSCEDADTDPRVENLAYSRLRPKSIMAVPVRAEQEVIAVLGSFSSAPNAFTNTQVAILRTVADSLSRPVQQLPLSPPSDEPPAPRPWPPATASPEPTGDCAAKPEPPAVAPAPPLPPPQPQEEVLTLADDVAPRPVAPRPVVTELRPSPPSVRVVTYSLPTSFEFASPRPRRWRGAVLRIVVITAACLVCALATAGWYSTRMPAAPARISAALPAPHLAASPTPKLVEPAAPAAITPAASTAVTSAATPAAPQTKLPPQAPVAAVTVPPSAPAPGAGTPAAEPIERTLPQPAAVTEAPALAFSAPSALPALVTPHAAAPKIHHSEVVPARLESGAAPQYPPAARTGRIVGQVVLSVVVRKDGSVGDVKMLSGNPAFRNSAVDAVKHWRYAPATLDGEPVEATAQVTLKFDPGKR